MLGPATAPLKRSTLWLWILAGSSLAGLLAGLRLLLAYRALGTRLSLQDALWSGLMEWWLWIPLLPAVLWLARRFEPFASAASTRGNALIITLHALAAAALATAHVVLFSGLSGVIRSLRFDAALELNLSSPLLALFVPNYLVYVTLVSIYWWRLHRRRLHALQARPLLDEEHAPLLATRSIEFQAGRGLLSLRTEQIDWISAAGNYLELHTSGGSHLVRETLKSVQDRLGPEHFVRIHRSTLVRSEAVIGLIDGRQALLLLTDGVRLPVGASYREQLLERFGMGA